jgi:hypothetical protein
MQADHERGEMKINRRTEPYQIGTIDHALYQMTEEGKGKLMFYLKTSFIFIIFLREQCS